jgi:O-antigen/teichoic acid export membrane protein
LWLIIWLDDPATSLKCLDHFSRGHACDSEGEAVAAFLTDEAIKLTQQATYPQEEQPLKVEPATSSVDRKPQGGAPKKSSSRRVFADDVALTLGTEAATVISSLVLTSVLSRWLGARVLSEYLLLRRVLTWSVSGTLLGIATGLPRYVAHMAGHLEAAGHLERDEPGYLLAASFCLLPTATVVGALMVLYRSFFAKWLFGDPHESGLVIALAMLLFGFAIHRAVHGYYRGLLDMVRANLLELCGVAMLPLVVVMVFYRSQPIGAMMLMVGAVMTLIGALFAVPALRRLRHRPSGGTLGRRCTELLQYGLPRVPGEFGSAAILALGPILAAHYMDLAKVTPLLLGLNMLMVIGYAAAPLGTVLLSKVSMLLGQNQHQGVQVRLRLLVAAVMEVSVFTCIQLAIFADVVVRAWVGPGFEDGMDVIRIVLLAIPPYLFFVALRSTIDAATIKPYNTGNVLISLAAYLGLIVAWMAFFPTRSLLMGIAGSLLGSEVLLSVLTARTFRRFYGLSIAWRRLAVPFAVACVLGACALAFRHLWNGSVPLLQTILVEVLFTAIYLAVLARLGSGWIAYTWNVGIMRREHWQFNEAQP